MANPTGINQYSKGSASAARKEHSKAKSLYGKGSLVGAMANHSEFKYRTGQTISRITLAKELKAMRAGKIPVSKEKIIHAVSSTTILNTSRRIKVKKF